MVSREALETIKNIELHHMEVESDYDYEENLELSYYEEDDGTVEYNYFEEIKTIEKDLEVLKEHKQIEEELGIDLITLFKALTSAVYYRDEDNGINISYFPYLGRDKYYFIFNRENTVYLSIKDYGKTWALTAGELK